MRSASRILLALPAAAVAFDTALWHAPAYVAAVLLALCLLVLARRCWDWCRRRTFPRRVLAAVLLVFYTPRPVDGRLYEFVKPIIN
jgi:predicted membrane-bound mannosyltransferase